VSTRYDDDDMPWYVFPMIACGIAVFLGVVWLLVYFAEAPANAVEDWFRDELREWLKEETA
jgi:hypothetical protein